MKSLKSKFLTKIIVAICIFLALTTFAVPTKAYASWGGTLLTPIVDILVAIGDTIMEILHESIQAQDLAIIKIDGSETWWDIVSGIFAAALAILVTVIVFAVICYVTGGLAAVGAALAGSTAAAVTFNAGTVLLIGAISLGARSLLWKSFSRGGDSG